MRRGRGRRPALARQRGLRYSFAAFDSQGRREIAERGGRRYAGDLVDVEHGRISREIFTSRAVYEDELERVFARSWLFVGHESQVPEPGDFVLGRMGEESIR